VVVMVIGSMQFFTLILSINVVIDRVDEQDRILGIGSFCFIFVSMKGTHQPS